MSYTVRYNSKAEIEYYEAFDWYEKRSPGLGDRFEFFVENSIHYIVNNPFIYPDKKYNCRECCVENFPYLIIYKVYPELKIILIVSIFHTSRRPSNKYSL